MMPGTSDVSYSAVTKDDYEKDEEASNPEMRLFLHNHSRHTAWHDFRRPSVLALAASIVCITMFLVGFGFGKMDGHSQRSVSASVVKQLLHMEQAYVAKESPAHGSATSLGAGTAETNTVFDVLRSLPPIDLYQEYGMRHGELALYPEPLKDSICLVDVDTRKWKPHRVDEPKEPLHFGYFNHYLYAKLHGYAYKHMQVPELSNLNTTWVKVRELYRITMMDECRFVVMVDGDVIFPDLRVPMEALLSHWNITQDIMIAGGIDLDNTHDVRGRPQFNTGFLVTQDTPLFPKMMQDWIDCPTDVKYKTCSQWRWKWAREQAAFSGYIRYDPEYSPYIRHIPVEDVHQGRFTKHYWGYSKRFLAKASKQAILDRFVPDIYKGLLDDWSRVHEHVTEDVYEDLQKYTQHTDVEDKGKNLAVPQ
ncbi:hypothetical protein BDZ85DRAFT_45998 [Elsinoe ampelina]|uniref:Nucleotide-diphospho-sugar transferase domain-containing protein n=1 Tax=Elsinoe ampelina TaxID=302913 RepID=A0A6A6G0Q0_9PEZI|nr:hypothetical protein BDZ85DRAFT_59344 [Elsinoe ampelina]KAF2219216.1 hypothetical protein BDZ85DRAFT_45998 [Elsinoe ampelina]